MKINRQTAILKDTTPKSRTQPWQVFRLRFLVIWLLVGVSVVTMQNMMCAPAPAGFRSDRILIKPKEGIPLSTLAGLHTRLGSRVLRAFPRIGGLQVVQLPRLASVPTTLAAYRLSGLVAYAEPDFIMRVLMEPNDFRYGNGDLWNFKNLGQYGGTSGADIHAPEGWDIQNTASNIIVAVIDTGVRYTHEDLAPNMWVNPGETGLDEFGRDKATNGVDDDGDGYIDDVHGINTLLNNGDPNDDYGHGSHVAGIIGAAGKNSVGVGGGCWRGGLIGRGIIDSRGDRPPSPPGARIGFARGERGGKNNARLGGEDRFF